MTWHIVSVGTSLIKRYNDENDQKILQTKEAWDCCESEYLSRLNEFICAKNVEEIKELSAELSSLLKKEEFRPGNGDYILLLYTETKQAAACAGLVKKALEKLGYTNLACCQIDKLSEAHETTFYDEGLPNLIQKLYQVISSAHDQRQKVILIPTGGYKAIIPYYVIMGVLMDVPCRYVYEDSNEVIELPPLPMHVDLQAWTSIEGILETLMGKKKGEAFKWKIFEKEKKKIQNFIITKSGKIQLSPLCQLLQERVNADRCRPELQFRTQNSPLLPYLIKDGSETLKKKFLRLAAIGPYIWKGDRVPEMADHALLHHADLFHLAERILLPVFYFFELKKREPFLTPEELFILLGALHLHDCGHVVGKVDFREHRLLPTEVRDFHHILGFLRLTEPEAHGGTGRWIHNALKGPVKDTPDEEAWNEKDLAQSLFAIAVIGLYHRKKVNLVQVDEPFDFIAGAKWKNNPLEAIPCLAKFLEKNPLKINELIIEGERVKLLISLLRIIDSLDEQWARTGGEEAVDFHLQQLENEAREEDIRAEGLQSALNSVENLLPPEGRMACSRVIKLDTLVDRLFSSYIGRESKTAQNTVSQEDIPWSFWDEFKKVFKSDNGQKDPLEPLGLEYAISRIAAKFKRFQKEPYEEKIHIEEIEISHCFEDDCVLFDIDLRCDSILPADKKKNLLKSMAKEFKIKEKIDGKEAPVVQKTLINAGIFFNYRT